ncbi:cpii coat sec24 protein [Ceraceosorus bombacis]|uniref:Cpii coat sec24 protein n=1 Tax=Ceraceosorus bombacis TaxID=401625 RepID=A0A0P1BGU1_9BASI|nr:cpii coat sec24 protein [Ceraceosorus bombacis]
MKTLSPPAESATGRTSWTPPNAGMPGARPTHPQGQARMSLPPMQGPPSMRGPSGLGGPPTTANSVSFSGGFDPGAGGGAGYPGHIPQDTQQSQLFTPGAPEPQAQLPGASPGVPSTASPYGQPAAYPGQQAPNGHAQQPYPGQQGVSGLANQFQHMGIGSQVGARGNPLLTVNLSGVNPVVTDLNRPPPDIKLPPGASVSQNPLANADPSYQRCTLNAVPTTSALLNKSKIPFGLVLSPYRSVREADGDQPVPVVSDTVIARCRRCRTYINPYVTFIEGGNRWKCCMCNISNEVPNLFDWDQETNQPADRYQRPELNHSVVEFIAPREYMVRPPQPPVYVFLIDVSQVGVNSGMVSVAAKTILETLDRLPNDDNRAKISIIAVDTALHFFCLPVSQTEPEMLVVSDLDDVFLPKPNDILVNLTECRAGVEALLQRLPDMFKDTLVHGSALGASLQAAYKLVSAIGGKIMVLTASLPTVGPGALKNREDIKLLGTSKESTLLNAASTFYKTFPIDCSRSQVSVDMFLFAQSYTDVATLACLPRYTGGQTYFYPAFHAGRAEDAAKFAHEFGEVLASPISFEAVLRLRATKGVRAVGFHGNFFVRSTDLLALPAVPLDQSYAIECEIEETINAPFIVLQSVVLHSTSYGERRIRVVNLALPTTTSLSEVYAGVDQVAVAVLLANKAVERSIHHRLEDARDALTNKMVDILQTYKATMTSAGSGASPQLAIASNMALLPLLILSLLKHVGIRASSQIPSDLRAYAQALLTTLPAQLLIPYLHPDFYCLHNMPPEAGTTRSEDGREAVIFPAKLNLSSERLERHGLYMIDAGPEGVMLWLGRDAVPQLCIDVFGAENYQSVRGGKTTLPVLENAMNKRVRTLVDRVRVSRRGPYLPHVFIVKEDGEPALRLYALSMLVQDRFEQSPSYVQWLGTLRDKVNGAS